MRALIAVSVLAAAATLATSAAAQSSPNFQIAVRKGAMNLQSKYASPLFAMARGAVPYDAPTVQRNVEFLSVITQTAWGDFQPNSIGLSNTKAKDVILKEPEKFKQLIDELQANLQKVATASRSGDQGAFKSAALSMGRTCNSCHEHFSDFDYRFKLD
jgi:cytochrome c556